MDIDSCFQLGYITKPHGLNGDVSIVIDADYPEAYRNLESVFIEQDKQLVPFFVSKINISGTKAILALEESNSVESAKQLKGASLYLPLSFLPELESDQFYFHEIIGFEVVDKAIGNIGKVTTVYDVGPQDILAFDHNGHEVLLPINDDTVLSLEREKRLLHVEIPNGLLEIYTEEEGKPEQDN